MSLNVVHLESALRILLDHRHTRTDCVATRAAVEKTITALRAARCTEKIARPTAPPLPVAMASPPIDPDRARAGCGGCGDGQFCDYPSCMKDPGL